MLAESGVNRVMLSVDAFHQETVPLAPVELFAERVRTEGIPVEIHPAWLKAPESDNEFDGKTRELMKSFREKGYSVSEGNIIFLKGKAVDLLGGAADEAPADPYEEDPGNIRSLCFDADGGVLGGSIYKNDIIDIIKAYSPV